MPADLSGRPILGVSADIELFVDRERELDGVLRGIERRASVLVLGERGSGRTSLLHVVAARLAENGVRSIFLEGSLVRGAAELLQLLRYRISPQLPFSLPPSWRVGEVPPSAQLLEQVAELERALAAPGAPHAILVDEPSAPEIAHTLFGRLRDELWRLPLVWVVAGTVDDRSVYLRPPADAFFARVITLDPLDGRTALSLLRARVPRSEATDADLRAIVAAADGNPRRLVRLAGEMVVEGRKPHELAAAERQREQVMAGLGEAAQRVVHEIEANGPASASDDQFLRRVGMKRSRAAQVLLELERAGVLHGAAERGEGRKPRKLYAIAE